MDVPVHCLDNLFPCNSCMLKSKVEQHRFACSEHGKNHADFHLAQNMWLSSRGNTGPSACLRDPHLLDGSCTGKQPLKYQNNGWSGMEGSEATFEEKCKQNKTRQHETKGAKKSKEKTSQSGSEIKTGGGFVRQRSRSNATITARHRGLLLYPPDGWQLYQFPVKFGTTGLQKQLLLEPNEMLKTPAPTHDFHIRQEGQLVSTNFPR